jgi:hypothetical protein
VNAPAVRTGPTTGSRGRRTSLIRRNWDSCECGSVDVSGLTSGLMLGSFRCRADRLLLVCMRALGWVGHVHAGGTFGPKPAFLGGLRAYACQAATSLQG